MTAQRHRTALCPLLWLVAAAAAATMVPAARAQDTAGEEKEEGKKGEGVRFVFKKHPSFRMGDWLRLDFRARVQMDWEVNDPEFSRNPDLFEFGRKRFGVEGVLFRHFEFEVSREFAPTDFAWKDVYGNFRYFKRFQIMGGRFRIPFSMDALTGPTNLDFIERSRVAARIGNNRDTGVMAHANLFKKRLGYQFGYFFNDGDTAATGDNVRTGQGTVAGRVTAEPLGFIGGTPKLLKDLTIGFAANTTDVPEGLNSLRGRTYSGETFFPHYFVRGRRIRTGSELAWMPGPFSLKAEYLTASEQRLGQSLAAADLPDLLTRGWYAAGTWVVTGQNKAKGLARGRYIPFVRGRFGALELVTRYEQIRFASDTQAGRPSRSTRAANVLQTSDRLWTFGVNWYVNQWTKIQANFVREWLEDGFRAPIQFQNLFWTYKVRLQLAL